MNNIFCATVIIFSSFVSGCANTSGSYHLTSGTALNNAQISKFSDLIISVQPTNSVKLNKSDTDRITDLIVENIKSENSNQFKSINSTSPSLTTLQASVAIKNYDEGLNTYRF